MREALRDGEKRRHEEDITVQLGVTCKLVEIPGELAVISRIDSRKRFCSDDAFNKTHDIERL